MLRRALSIFAALATLASVTTIAQAGSYGPLGTPVLELEDDGRPEGSGVELQWSSPKGGSTKVTGYEVARAAGDGPFTVVHSNGKDRDWTDASAAAGVAYRYVVRAGYRDEVGPWSNVVAVRGEAPSSPPEGPKSGTVVFSFDDGERSALVAARILELHGMRGTFFVVPDWFRDPRDRASPYLSAAEVAGLAARGHDVESHTMTHEDLTLLGPASLAWELTASQATLETLTGRPVRHLAYPYGSWDRAVAAATSATYATGRVVTTDVTESLLVLPPTTVPGLMVLAATSLEEAKAYVDFARDRDATVVLVFHDLRANPDTYDWTVADFESLVAYTAGAGVAVETYAEAYA